MTDKEDLSQMSDAKLRRKEHQAWEMAGLARQDGDAKDEARHTEAARRYAAELDARRR